MTYRTKVFGHPKSFRVHQVVIGSPEGVPDTPDKCMGLMGQTREQTSPLGGWCALLIGWLALGEGKGRGGPSCLSLLRRERKGGPPPLTFLPHSYMERGRGLGKSPSRIRPYLGRPLASPLSPTYMYVGGGTTHNHDNCLAMCSALLHRLHPQSYFRSA